MARQLKELRNLMPWTWDARVEDHPPGEAAMRDFQDAFSWTGRPSRNAHQPEAATASPRHKPASAALAQAKKRPCKENTSSRPAKRSIRRRDCGEADPPATNSKPLHRVSFKTPSDAGADEPSATSSPACRQSSVLDAKMEVAGTDCVTVPGTVKKDPVSSHRLEASTLAEATPIAVHVDGAMTPGSAISAQTPAVGLQSRSSMGLDTGDNTAPASASLELWPAAPLDVESSFVSEGPPLDEEMSTVFGERSFTDDEQPAKDPSGLLGNHLQQRPAKELPLFSPGGPKELLPAVKSPAMLGSEVLTPAMPLDLRPALPASAMVTRSNRQSRGRGPPATFRVPDTRANAVLRGCARLRISDARAGWLY
ncbi:hypothetical protein WJX72_007088 [[Myrmecia] bisecta]|uniref:Uncharacterized protein n=1 Tax=[Myrmecia] bisecta TaxID=41462 RepID=A0AAW1PY65_9CHLO